MKKCDDDWRYSEPDHGNAFHFILFVIFCFLLAIFGEDINRLLDFTDASHNR